MADRNSWLEIESGNPDGIVLVDCGYVDDEAARNRADKILALGVGEKNIELVGTNRLAVKIPKTKVKRIFATLPISDKKTYFGCTHSFLSEVQSLE